MTDTDLITADSSAENGALPLAGVGQHLVAQLARALARLPEQAREALSALGRQALHAAVLGFAHPATGEEMLFQSEPPEDFANLQAALASL